MNLTLPLLASALRFERERDLEDRGLRRMLTVAATRCRVMAGRLFGRGTAASRGC
ncbi:MAG: hypothetical protein XU10_C0008G0005 [Chloroflexi bacterium CSP1-4]|nr:MAG: hypothetical protein XU10_C0008G0005 [Chloroflexi bacterium CSP1-4]